MDEDEADFDTETGEVTVRVRRVTEDGETSWIIDEYTEVETWPLWEGDPTFFLDDIRPRWVEAVKAAQANQAEWERNNED